MHWTAAQPGCLDTERELILIDQTPGEIVFLSAADTDLACVAATWSARFGNRLRIAHAFPLRQPVAADHYVANVIRYAKLVVARLLGGKAYFAHFIQALSDLKDEAGDRPQFLILSGTDANEEELAALSDFPSTVCKRMFDFFKHGGSENMRRAAECIERLLEKRHDDLPQAEPMSEFGIYKVSRTPGTYIAWLCFYRAWYQAGDLEVVDSLCAALEDRGFRVYSFYSFSLRNPAAQAELLRLAREAPPHVVLTTQSFSICTNEGDRLSFFEQLGCPVLQVPVALGSRNTWESNTAGLPPAEIAMSVALPEIDGRLFGTVAGFKENDKVLPEVQSSVKRLTPDLSQIAFVAQWALRWANLRELPNAEKKVVVILSNYPNHNGRIGNGVGLDTPASTVNLLRALRVEGYLVEPVPENGEELMQWLQDGITNDLEHSYGKPCRQTMDRVRLETFLETLPAKRREELDRNWKLTFSDDIPVAGMQLGNIFVGIQPPRGYSLQPQAIYHSPTLPPPPEYLAFYLWIREVYGAHAIVHLGKHGNLEWLPGRGVALGEDDYPRLCLGTLPHLYPFIVNNPGEGTQAKRRTSAAIIDHLTPPLTRAGLYGDLEKVERLLEEHAHCVALYPSRAADLEREIEQLLALASWSKELPGGAKLIETVGNFLCEIKEGQIRSALHILGEKPVGEKEIDFLLSLLRVPSGDRPGLMEALHGGAVDLEELAPSERDKLEGKARVWIADALKCALATGESADLKRLREVVHCQLSPRLAQCGDELRNIIHGLDGKFVPPGPAGAPTRGRLDVLPTGRNFFGIDPRVIPTPTSWRCGKDMADLLLERYRQEHGEYPRKLALVVWGTSNMRTGGDDIAQTLWLWGCEPVWEESSGRVVDFRILPLSLLGRPRVDVLLRVSGLFRDAFGDTMRLLATVPKRLAEQDEPPELNPIREAWLRDRESLVQQGLDSYEATRRATLRVFSSQPGSYGTGLLPLIDAGNWSSKNDLTEVFCKWGGHAFDSDGTASESIELFRERLAEIEVIHQNQDNREHDVLDSDDYFQFQGGLQASIEQLRGSAPVNYHGDSSCPERLRVRTLKEELVRVIRSRVLNPRWIEAMRQHGYKGAFEMAATVDYLFGYGATTNFVEDHHYEEIAQALLLSPEQKEFFQRHNPVALQEAAERLLEAAERGVWKHPNEATLSALEENLLELQGQLE
jgi:cobaltochelatase CobN